MVEETQESYACSGVPDDGKPTLLSTIFFFFNVISTLSVVLRLITLTSSQALPTEPASAPLSANSELPFCVGEQLTLFSLG